MNAEPNPRAVAGHNAPPAEAVILERVDALVRGTNTWLSKVREIGDPDTASACRDMIAQLAEEMKAADAERVRQKKPHDDAAALVQAKFKTPLALLDTAHKAMKRLMGGWLDAERKRLDDERRAAEVEAARKVAEAEAAARKAEQAKGDIIGNQVAAAMAAEAAAAAQDDARRAAEAKPQVQGDIAGRAMSLRTYYSAEIKDLPQVVRNYLRHPKMLALMQELADADARTMKEDFDVPGCDIKIDRRAA